MGHRLSKIYTRTGDKGETGLGDGTRTRKDSLRVEAFGTVDELNSALGMVLADHTLPDDIRSCLIQIQHQLFDVGSELSLPSYIAITAEHITQLEQILDEFNQTLEPLKEFILPGGYPAAASCHLARTICRRAERCVVTLASTESINDQALIYLNRLSDLLFVMARVINKRYNVEEPMWKHERKKTQT
jgi:cob(I)alamin adenosyltransferase